MITSIIGIAFLVGLVLLIQERRKKVGEFNLPVIETNRPESALLEFDIHEPADGIDADTIAEDNCAEERYNRTVHPNSSVSVITSSRDTAGARSAGNGAFEMENLRAGSSNTALNDTDESHKEQGTEEKGYGTHVLTRDQKQLHEYNNSSVSTISQSSPRARSSKAQRKGTDTVSKHFYHYPKVRVGEANQPDTCAPTDDDGYLVPHGSVERIDRETLTQHRPKPSPSKASKKQSSPYEVVEIAKTTYSKKPQPLRTRGSPAPQTSRVKSHVYQNTAVEQLNKNSEEYDTLGVWIIIVVIHVLMLQNSCLARQT